MEKEIKVSSWRDGKTNWERGWKKLDLNTVQVRSPSLGITCREGENDLSCIYLWHLKNCVEIIYIMESQLQAVNELAICNWYNLHY